VKLWIGIACTIGCAESHGTRSSEASETVEVGTSEVDVLPGTEAYECFYIEAPFDEASCVGRIEIESTPGLHHAALYRAADEEPGTAIECRSESGLPAPVFDTREVDFAGGQAGWTLPAGVAWRVGARDRLMLLVHYVNTATREGLTGRATLRLERVDCEGTEDIAPFVFPVEGDAICFVPQDMTILAASAYCGSLAVTDHAPFLDGDRFEASTADLSVPVDAGETVRFVEYEPAYMGEGACISPRASLVVTPTIAGIVCR
jgi:hypothetical protein